MSRIIQTATKRLQKIALFSAIAFATPNEAEIPDADSVNRRLKVALISHSSGLYGAQRQLLDLASALPSFGVDPVMTLPDDGPLADEAHGRGIATVVLPYRNWLHNRSAFQWWRKQNLTNRAVQMALRQPQLCNIDLVHSNTFTTPFGALLAEKLGRPHIWHVHERAGEGKQNPFLKASSDIRAFAVSHTNYAVGPSNSLCGWMEKYFDQGSIYCIPNGIFTPESSFLDPWPRNDSQCILSLGRLGKAKGTLTIVEALAILRQQGLDATLSLAGDVGEEYWSDLMSRAGQLGVSESIQRLGFVRDPASLYRTHDVLLIGSEYESFGRVAIEAMMNGCPVVSTRCGGPEEIIQEGCTGLLVRVGDADQMSYAIRWLWQNPVHTEEIRTAALIAARERYSVEKYAERFRDLYLRATVATIRELA